MTQEVVQLNSLQNSSLLNSLQVGVLLEKDRKVVWANRYFFVLFGIDAHDVIGNTMRACFYTDADYAGTVITGADTFSKILNLRRMDDSTIRCRLTGKAVVEDDLTQGFMWSFTAIDEPAHIEKTIPDEYAALAEKYRRQEALLDNVQIALLLVKDRKVVWGNQCFYDMLAYRPEDLVGQSARFYFHNEEDFVRIGQEGYPLLKAGKPYASELLLKCRNGTTKWCLITGNAVEPENPEEGYIWSFVDITARIQAEAREREAIEREQVETEKMAALGVVVAGVAHEINTPIGVGYTLVTHFRTKTKEFAVLFESGAMRRSDLQQYVELSSEMSTQLITNISRASELIQSFKKIAVDQSRDDQREFNLKEYLQEIAVSLKPTLRKTPHRIKLDCPDDIVMNSYPGALSQITTNLVMNALLHAFGAERSGTMNITVRLNGEQVQINFADDGKGIPAEHLPKIFDPFFTTKRGSGGSGLGLNIVFNMVTRKLRGRVTCSSVEGEGTVFKIEIPLIIDVNMEKVKESPNDFMQSYKRTINKGSAE
ncbi:MAG TPA: PAS domain-containing sensor histidine kinase [Burkholderiaceae bacterium]|jgi:PAS domain S-box-containing protein